jgi:hypothetical protein
VRCPLEDLLKNRKTQELDSTSTGECPPGGDVPVFHSFDGGPFLANMSARIPVRTKLKLLLRNNWLKVSRRRGCCEHLGEPGC